MEENEDEPEDVRLATPVEDEIKRGEQVETVEERPKIPKKVVGDNEAKKRKKTENDEDCCDQKKKLRREKESKLGTVYVFEKECKVKKSNTVPRHCLSKKEHLDVLATPSQKCPSQCIKKRVTRKLKPLPLRIEELAKPRRQHILSTIEDRGDNIAPEILYNLIKMIENESSLTPEQAAQLFCDKKKRSTKKCKKKKHKMKCHSEKEKDKRKEKRKENGDNLSLDPEAVCCQYLMAEKFVKSILNWKCPIPREEYQDIAEVILKRLSFILEYTPTDNADRKSQQMRFLADIVSCWISGVLIEVAEVHRKELEEECERRKQEKEEEETDEDEDESEREESILTPESEEESDEDDEEEPEKKEKKDKSVQKDDVAKEKKSKKKESTTQTPKPELDEKEVEADIEDIEEKSEEPKGIVETERLRIEEAEKKRLEEEEAERIRIEAIEKRKMEREREQEEEEEKKRKVEEEAERKRLEEEAEQRRLEEEAEQKRLEEEEAEQWRLEQEAEQKRLEEEAEQRRLEEEAEQKRLEEEAEQKRLEEEAEQKRLEEEAEQKRLEEEAEKEIEKAGEEKDRKEVGFDMTKGSEEAFRTAIQIEVKAFEPTGQSTPLEEDLPVKAFQTDLPFITFIGIFNTIYKIIEKEPENIGKDLTTNRLHRSIYEKFHNAVKLENPILLTNNAKDVIDVVSGKIAVWLSKVLSESQILLLNKYSPEVETVEVRDWTKWLNYTTKTAADWTIWLQNLIKEAQKMQDDQITRGQWEEWTQKLDKNATLWRRFHLDTLHQAHHNAMMIKDREVVKTGEKKIPEEITMIKEADF